MSSPTVVGSLVASGVRPQAGWNGGAPLGHQSVQAGGKEDVEPFLFQTFHPEQVESPMVCPVRQGDYPAVLYPQKYDAITTLSTGSSNFGFMLTAQLSGARQDNLYTPCLWVRSGNSGLFYPANVQPSPSVDIGASFRSFQLVSGAIDVTPGTTAIGATVASGVWLCAVTGPYSTYNGGSKVDLHGRDALPSTRRSFPIITGFRAYIPPSLSAPDSISGNISTMLEKAALVSRYLPSTPSPNLGAGPGTWTNYPTTPPTDGFFWDWQRGVNDGDGPLPTLLTGEMHITMSGLVALNAPVGLRVVITDQFYNTSTASVVTRTRQYNSAVPATSAGASVVGDLTAVDAVISVDSMFVTRIQIGYVGSPTIFDMASGFAASSAPSVNVQYTEGSPMIVAALFDQSANTTWTMEFNAIGQGLPKASQLPLLRPIAVPNPTSSVAMTVEALTHYLLTGTGSTSIFNQRGHAFGGARMVLDEMEKMGHNSLLSFLKPIGTFLWNAVKPMLPGMLDTATGFVDSKVNQAGSNDMFSAIGYNGPVNQPEHDIVGYNGGPPEKSGWVDAAAEIHNAEMHASNGNIGEDPVRHYFFECDFNGGFIDGSLPNLDPGHFKLCCPVAEPADAMLVFIGHGLVPMSALSEVFGEDTARLLAMNVSSKFIDYTDLKFTNNLMSAVCRTPKGNSFVQMLYDTSRSIREPISGGRAMNMMSFAAIEEPQGQTIESVEASIAPSFMPQVTVDPKPLWSTFFGTGVATSRTSLGLMGRFTQRPEEFKSALRAVTSNMLLMPATADGENGFISRRLRSLKANGNLLTDHPGAKVAFVSHPTIVSKDGGAPRPLPNMLVVSNCKLSSRWSPSDGSTTDVVYAERPVTFELEGVRFELYFDDVLSGFMLAQQANLVSALADSSRRGVGLGTPWKSDGRVQVFVTSLLSVKQEGMSNCAALILALYGYSTPDYITGCPHLDTAFTPDEIAVKASASMVSQLAAYGRKIVFVTRRNEPFTDMRKSWAVWAPSDAALGISGEQKPWLVDDPLEYVVATSASAPLRSAVPSAAPEATSFRVLAEKAITGSIFGVSVSDLMKTPAMRLIAELEQKIDGEGGSEAVRYMLNNLYTPDGIIASVISNGYLDPVNSLNPGNPISGYVLKKAMSRQQVSSYASIPNGGLIEEGPDANWYKVLGRSSGASPAPQFLVFMPDFESPSQVLATKVASLLAVPGTQPPGVVGQAAPQSAIKLYDSYSKVLETRKRLGAEKASGGKKSQKKKKAGSSAVADAQAAAFQAFASPF